MNNMTYMNLIDIKKKEFIHREACSLCFIAAFGMARRVRFFKEGVKEVEREPVREYFRKELWKLSVDYSNKVQEIDHIKNIEEFINKSNIKWIKLLAYRGITFGRAQKLINLYLKYMWVCGYISEPPHCPIDSKIIGKLGTEFRGLSYLSMDKNKYMDVISCINNIRGAQSIAEWELSEFNRR